MFKELVAAFEQNANPKIAADQSAYMRNQYQFFGLKSPERKELARPFFKTFKKLDKKEALQVVTNCWKQPCRELHYVSQEMYFKHAKVCITEKSDIKFMEWLVTHNSWWDTIDFIAPRPMKYYFDKFPEERNKKVDEWIASDNIWLKRCALLIHLKKSEEVDLDYMFETILRLCGTGEFFIDKAIGWDLREHSKKFPNEIRKFIEANKDKLANLSIREGSKYV